MLVSELTKKTRLQIAHRFTVCPNGHWLHDAFVYWREERRCWAIQCRHCTSERVRRRRAKAKHRAML